MRNNLRVTFNLDRVVCHDEADGWGSAEPYMWTVFFKIDGTTCKLNDSLFLEGTATVFTTPGSHGNLGDTDVDEGDTVNIPAAIGFQDLTMTPIPVPQWVKDAGTDDVTAVAGCIVVLMEEDNVTDDGAEAGHQALNVAVQNALDSLIPTLGFTNQEISDEDIDALTDQIQSKVEDAVQDQQNFFENIWSWLNPDDTIGTVVWKFSGDDLLDENPIALQKRWSNGNGDWELFGSVETVELPTCPADVVKAIFDALFGGQSSQNSMNAMHDFRNEEMRKYAGLGHWWKLAERNSHYLKMAVEKKEVAAAAAKVFGDIPSILRNRDKSISEDHLSNMKVVLNRISELNAKDRSSRKDIKRSTDALEMLHGKTINEIFETLSLIRPARYPTKNTDGSNERIKLPKRSKD